MVQNYEANTFFLTLVITLNHSADNCHSEIYLLLFNKNCAKMMQTFILFLILILVVRHTQGFNFEVVSTTERPSPKNDNQIDFQECCSGAKETNYRLLILELQNAQLQKRVEKLDQIEKQFTLNEKDNDSEILFQELKKNHELLQHSIEKLEKRLEELTKQYNDKFKKLNELDVKLQLEEKQTFQATDVKKNISGGYVIDLCTIREFTVFCDMLTDGGGWTHVLTRIDGSQNFELGWDDYKKGFGDPSRNFWIGLEPLYQLTNSGDYELFVELVDWDNKTFYARYSKFKIGSEKDGYPLKVIEGYSGDAGDGLLPLINMKFSTKDKDQDDDRSTDCAKYFKGGWWYKSCYVKAGKLTGIYSKNISKTYEATGIHWLAKHEGTLQKAKMMIRPVK